LEKSSRQPPTSSSTTTTRPSRGQVPEAQARMAEPGDAVAFICDAPFAVHEVLLGHLSPKWILRMRTICKTWRKKLWHGPLLSFLHRLELQRPLICFDRVACYCVESLDLGSDKLRSILRFTDNEDYDFDEYDLEGLRRDAPPSTSSV
jgi:hypothetical protein